MKETNDRKVTLSPGPLTEVVLGRHDPRDISSAYLRITFLTILSAYGYDLNRTWDFHIGAYGHPTGKYMPLMEEIEKLVASRVQETYNNELAGKNFTYDGEKSLVIIRSLSNNKNDPTVVLKDDISKRNNRNASPDGNDNPNKHERKRARCSYESNVFKVEISFVVKIPMQEIQSTP
ncbi:protein argonaute 4B-like [Hibiscus syriacus]|uniref:protein argonaute 4B-like n=1 Tax=Hibiscus syriacus TaxID=106335 RepID=UPI001923E734|nr:protein argonaute 4B-like [Hibiscus syriacus]